MKVWEDNKMSRRNIVLISNLFPNPVDQIRGVFVWNMVKHLRNKADVTVICPLPWFPKINLLKRFKSWYSLACVPREFLQQDIKVISPKYLAIPKAGFLQSISIFFTILPVLLKLNKQKKIDLINAQWIFPDGVAACWAAKMLKILIALSAHGCDINLYSKLVLRRPQIINALKSANVITVVSGAQKEVIKDLGIDQQKVNVIHNGVDFSEYFLQDKQECRKQVAWTDKSKMILFIGQIIEVKGLKYLIEAIELLVKKQNKDFKVIIIGSGHLRSELEKEIEKKNLQEYMCFLGQKSREEVPLWYGACDILCLPSIREGCPSVIIEALASGRPIVASRVGGIPELLNDKNGILFNPTDGEDLSVALEKALARDWDAKSIREGINDYSWENVADKYLDVFNKVLDRK